MSEKQDAAGSASKVFQEHGTVASVAGSAALFQEILKERSGVRKAKAEAERKEGLRRIREMQSKSGKEPLEIFPKEMWSMIMDELGPEDKGNISGVHPTFRSLLEKHRIRDVLLPQILDFGVRRVRKEEEDEEYVDVDPLLRNDVLALRGVSRSMKRRFDELMDQTLKETMDDLFKFTTPGKLTIPLSVESNAAGENTFNKTIRHVKRGLPHRSLFVDLFLWPIVNDFDVLKNKVTKLLRVVGERMWHFALDVPTGFLEREGVNLLDVYKALHEWLGYMPNLKWLQLNFDGDLEGSWNQLDCLGSGSTLEVMPPPKLNYLQRLDFHMPMDLIRVDVLRIIDAILAANDDVEYVDFEYDLGIPELQQLCIPKIWDLPLTKVGLGLGEDFRVGGNGPLTTTITQLRQAMNPDWELKQLMIAVDVEKESIASVIDLLNGYPSLEEVRVEVENVKIGGDDIPFLHLPDLTYFRFRMLNSPEIDFSGNAHLFFSMQFMLYLKNIRRIDWVQHFARNMKNKLQKYMKKFENVDEMLQFGGGWKDLCHSNLWTAFPYLETIVITTVDNTKKLSYSEFWIYERGHDSCSSHSKSSTKLTN